MNKHLKFFGIVAVLFVFILTACATPTADKSNDRMPPVPTGGLPETIEDAVKESEDPIEEISVEMPPDPLDNPIGIINAEMPPDPLDIEMVPLMFQMEPEQFLAQYHGMIEGMIFTRAIDLEVVDIVDDSANAQFGFMFEALVTVRNNGFITSPEVKLSCEIPGTGGLGGWRWVAPLAPGESRDLRTGFTSSSMAGGTYDYTCTVDSDNTLIEFNKLNNTKTIIINPVMTRTDLAILSVEEITRTPVIGYDHEFKVTVENIGPERSYKVLMRCSYPKGLTEEEQVVFVGQMDNPGDTVEVICGFNNVPAGKHELLVEVDWGNQIDEKNEKNNTATLKFTE